MDNIILIGFMGSGKTSLGKQLARARKCCFYDTDHMIEQKYNKTISQIFKEQGEEYFRLLETAMLEQLLSKNECFVLSVGGGLPIRPENHEYLKKIGKIIYLNPSKEVLIGRLRGDKNRPLLKGNDLEKKIDLLMNERKEVYETLANQIIDTDGMSFEEIISQINEVIRDEDFSD